LYYKPGVNSNYHISSAEIQKKYMSMGDCSYCKFKGYSVNATASSGISLDKTGGINVRPTKGTKYFSYTGEYGSETCGKVFPWTTPVLNFKTTVCGLETLTEKDTSPIRIQMYVGEASNMTHIAISDLLSNFSNSIKGCGFDPTSMSVVKDKRGTPLEITDSILRSTISFNRNQTITIKNDMSITD
jgi:hypothetical protein